MHAHDVRNAKDFKNLRVLIVGSGYSAEDIASMIWKNGGKHIVLSYRSNPIPYKWPEGKFTTKPLLKSLQNHTATFIDDSTEEIDAVIMCTGYIHDIDFMHKDLRLATSNGKVFVDQAYKGIFWQQNPKLIYLGMVGLHWTFPLYDIQAWYCRDVILGKLPLPNKEER